MSCQLLHEFGKFRSKTTIECRRCERDPGAAAVGSAKTGQATPSTTLKAQHQGVDERHNVDLALPLDGTQAAGTPTNELGRNQTGQGIANVTYSGAGHLCPFGSEHP